MNRKHPLAADPDWLFDQPEISVSSYYRAIPLRGGSPARRKVSGASTCREGLVDVIRSSLSNHLCRVSEGSIYSWQRVYERAYRMDLDHSSLRQPFSTTLTIESWALTLPTGRPSNVPSQRTVDGFLRLADATVGLLNVLLNPDRFQGDWWTSDEENQPVGRRRRSKIQYFGVDNTLLYHPALLSLYTGLLRQCALIAGARKLRRALERVERKKVRQALTRSDPGLAWELFQKMRPWVEVPLPGGAYTDNMPVAPGSWAKIPALHKALYAYGFERTFQGKPEDCWNVEERDLYGREVCSGIDSYLGPRGGNAEARRIKALASRTTRAEGGWRKR